MPDRSTPLPRNVAACPALVLLVALASAACAPPPDVCDEPAALPPAAWDQSTGLPHCDWIPGLCGLEVTSDITEPDLAVAIDLVFLGDGYRADELAAFDEHVDTLVRGARRDLEGILLRAPALFNVHRVGVVSASDDPADRQLSTCVERSELLGDWLLASDETRVARAAANAPDADVVVVIGRGTRGRPNAPTQPLPGSGARRINLHEEDSHRTLTHELGHAIFGLADEYVEVAAEHPYAAGGVRTSESRISPNVSLRADETWGGDHTGAIEGADLYAHGVYRPTDTCRMRQSDSDVGFCPVCSAHIDRWLNARRRQDGPPFCSVEDIGGADAVRLRAWDGNGLTSLRVLMNDELAGVIPVSARCPDCAPPRLILEDLAGLDIPVEQLILECEDARGATTRTRLPLP